MIDTEELDNNETVFACEMMAIEPTQREAHIENIQQLMGQVQSTRELADGYKLELPLIDDILIKAAQFVQLERLCCPFFSFYLELGPKARSFWLGLTGPAGVKPFIMAELGDYIPGLVQQN